MSNIGDLKIRMDISVFDSSQDGALNLALTDAQAYFKDYCNRE